MSEDPHDGIPGTPLKDLEIDGAKVAGWPYICNETTRVYHESLAETHGSGFRFAVLEWTAGFSGSPATKDSRRWGEDDHVEMLCHGEAFYDGVRHLWWGDPATDDEGYHYCPDLETLREVLTIVSGLELVYCDVLDRKKGPPRNEQGIDDGTP